MRNLWLDDIRPAPKGWYHAHSVMEAADFMINHEVENMSLDHDLGDFAMMGGDGVSFVLWMAENGNWPTGAIILHTMNPVGHMNMQSLIERYRPRQEEFVDFY